MPRRTRWALAGLAVAATLVPGPTTTPRQASTPATAQILRQEPPGPRSEAWAWPHPKPSPPPARQLRAAGAVESTGWQDAAASYYNDRPGSCDGRPVPAGLVFWTAHAAPHRTPLPCGTRVELEAADRSVVVVVWDRGPCRGWVYEPKRCVKPIPGGAGGWREFDLSAAAFRQLAGGSLSAGVLVVRWRIL